MPVIYQIREWDHYFENAQSRKVDQLTWVNLPNKHHGIGLTRILSETDGDAIYGVWCLLVGACSQQRLPRAGWLTEDGKPTGTPLTPDDLALKWRRPPPSIARALEVISGAKVGWIQRYENAPSEVIEPYQEPTTEVTQEELAAQRAENTKQFRELLVSKRLRVDGHAFEEWIGMVYGDCACRTMERVREFIAWMKSEGTRRGIDGQFARHYEVLVPVWRERHRRRE